ncbi:unnamed protein product [Phytophthora lilii]|uniref:Unnamed protein product n=1 Tax=Phytophthora lilii TaxID=2077276 RepID=A0A9W6XDE6_9STRA|nr:unnamed protein product [Phytophthora lilii]
MCNFIRSNGEQCKLARNKERSGKHPIIMDKETIVVESNIVEEMPPQVNTPVVAEVVDTPAPSVIEPVEASNIEVSKVPELNVEPVATDSARRQSGKFATMWLGADSSSGGGANYGFNRKPLESA